jgi:5-hydroxyisourate hydrolase-like protein (transthyretin family)
LATKQKVQINSLFNNLKLRNMNKMLIISILIGLFLLSCKDEEVRPSVIYVTATVTDNETSLPIDSVEVEFYKSGIGGRVILKHYYINSDGKTSFDITPEEGFNSYYLGFYKDGFLTSPSEGCGCEVSIDLDNEKQNYNIKLTKKQQ